MTNLPLRTLSLRLREARRGAGLSQKEAAESIGIHMNTLSRYEQDLLDPTAATLAALADLYVVSMEWLLIEHGARRLYLSDHAIDMNLVLSLPSVEFRVAEGAISKSTITDIRKVIEFLHWCERRRNKKARQLLESELAKSRTIQDPG